MKSSWIFALLSWLLPASAFARSVYLNNVNIDTVVGQKFENCTVEIDAKGNVFITAKGYKVEVAQPAPPALPGVTKRYWLVTEKPSPGLDQYEIEVFINNQSVKKIASGDEQIYLEVTKYMHGGDNAVYILAKKVIAGERKSTSPTHFSRIILGEGELNGRTITIDKQLLDYKRNASEVQNFSDPFTVVGR
jgi:hypothetical protein